MIWWYFVLSSFMNVEIATEEQLGPTITESLGTSGNEMDCNFKGTTCKLVHEKKEGEERIAKRRVVQSPLPKRDPYLQLLEHSTGNSKDSIKGSSGSNPAPVGNSEDTAKKYISSLSELNTTKYEKNATTPHKVSKTEWPWLVKLLKTDGSHLYTGSLITWLQVLTTCNAANDTAITNVTAGFRDKVEPQRRSVVSRNVDQRCRGKGKMKRYNAGIITVDKSFKANWTVNVIQFPTLNKVKYLELTDQLLARNLKCEISHWDSNGVLKIHSIEVIDSAIDPKCGDLQGKHEFVCSIMSNSDSVNETMIGSPVMCGEDGYGVLSHLKSGFCIWQRIDEFIQLIIEDSLEAQEFVKNVDY